VYRDNEADAVDYASWAACSPNVVKMAIAVGDWEEDVSSDRRQVFLMNAVSEEEQIRFALTNPDQSPWRNVSVARPIDREEALAHPDLPHVFEVVDAVVRDDPEISKALEV